MALYHERVDRGSKDFNHGKLVFIMLLNYSDVPEGLKEFLTVPMSSTLITYVLNTSYITMFGLHTRINA